MNQLTKNDVAKLNSSATILNFIDTILRQIVQAESNDNQEQQIFLLKPNFISNSTAALIIPCILAAYLTQIGYMFDPIDMAYIPPSRNTLSNIIEESSVTSILYL